MRSRKHDPDGPPKHVYVNTAIKDKEWEELREILGLDASQKEMIDYWCRNPASKLAHHWMAPIPIGGTFGGTFRIFGYIFPHVGTTNDR